jgi:hypothetical protein
MTARRRPRPLRLAYEHTDVPVGLTSSQWRRLTRRQRRRRRLLLALWRRSR